MFEECSTPVSVYVLFHKHPWSWSTVGNLAIGRKTRPLSAYSANNPEYILSSSMMCMSIWFARVVRWPCLTGGSDDALMQGATRRLQDRLHTGAGICKLNSTRCAFVCESRLGELWAEERRRTYRCCWWANCQDAVSTKKPVLYRQSLVGTPERTVYFDLSTLNATTLKN